MAQPRRKKAASKSSPRRAASPRKKSSTGGPPLWLIFTGLVAVGLVVYFGMRYRGSSDSAAEPLKAKVDQMAEENPDAEIFQLKEEPAPKLSEKKK